LIDGDRNAIRRKRVGTKVAAYYKLRLPKGGEATIHLRLCAEGELPQVPFGPNFDSVFEQRRRECDEFYEQKLPQATDAEERNVLRQAYAGLLWTKQFYHYVVKDWLEGDPAQP